MTATHAQDAELLIPSDVFDEETFRQSLKSSAARIPLIKRYIERTTDFLHQQFHSEQNIRELIWARSRFIDKLLTAIWDLYDWGGDIALAAVGGYGRGELHPHSDIDLLILFKEESGFERYREDIENFVTLLWDIKLDIGHSVRSVASCIEEAGKDITIATNLLEARSICGNRHLLEMTIHRIEMETWPSKDFFRAKWLEQINRHKKLENSENRLEPNIKNSPGGLRDIQTIGWITKRHFGTDSFEELVEQGFLTEAELAILNEGIDYLWRLRYWLHMITDNEEDRLLFDHQRVLAKMMGYGDDDAKLAVEHFMQEYYQWAQNLHQLNDLLIQHYYQTILRACEAETFYSINPRFNVRNGLIEVANDKVFEKTPSALLEIFVLMCEPNIGGARASTIRLIRESQHVMDETFRQDPRNARYFMEILRSPEKVALQLRRMLRYGVLGNYLPEFEPITGQMQHDLFHIYTVDAHTMKVVKNMRRFTYDDNEEHFPLAHNIIDNIEDKELLYIACLYHDIAKGRGGDHSELGVADALAFCERHGISKSDTQLIGWLVRYHLLMSSVAQRKDISDPEVVKDFVNVVGDERRLDFLYLLTVADINGTNPKLWNSWRDALLRQLYYEAKRVLRRGLENPVDKQDRIHDRQQQAISRLKDLGLTETEVLQLWQNRDEEYFLRERIEDIAWHTEAIAQLDSDTKTLIQLKPSSNANQGATQIFIYTEDKPSLFALVTSTLEHLDLNILDSRMYDCANNFVINTYYVLDSMGNSLSGDLKRLATIGHELHQQFDNSTDYRETVSIRTPRQLKSFSTPTITYMHQDESLSCSVLEVITPDRPGLLARIGKIFSDFSVQIKNVKIATLGERVEDIFYITDQDGEPITDPAIQQQLQQSISQELDQQNLVSKIV